MLIELQYESTKHGPEMKLSFIIHVPPSPVAVALAATLILGCSAPVPDDLDYEEQLMRRRAERDAFLRTGTESPVPAGKRAHLLPLSYYPPDLAFRIPATLVLFDEPEVLEIPTSTGSIEQMQRVGALQFLLDGKIHALSALLTSSEGRLFVPFRDETSGIETYGGGRYLDLDVTPTNIYGLDFNLAYHPNCYFDDAWICPLPPPENQLHTTVRAGERLP